MASALWKCQPVKEEGWRGALGRCYEGRPGWAPAGMTVQPGPGPELTELIDYLIERLVHSFPPQQTKQAIAQL